MTDQFYSLINLSQTGSLKKEVVNYDDQTLKDALEYLTNHSMKPTLQRWIRTELATRSRVRGDTRYSKGFASTSWAINWCEEWDKARQDILKGRTVHEAQE